MQYVIKGLYFSRVGSSWPFVAQARYTFQKQLAYTNWRYCLSGTTFTRCVNYNYNGYVAFWPNTLFYASSVTDLTDYGTPPYTGTNWGLRARTVGFTATENNGDIIVDTTEQFNYLAPSELTLSYNYPPIYDLQTNYNIGDSVTIEAYPTIQIISVSSFIPNYKAILDPVSQEVGVVLGQNGFNETQESEHLTSFTFRPSYYKQYYADKSGHKPIERVSIVTDVPYTGFDIGKTGNVTDIVCHYETTWGEPRIGVTA